MAPRIALWSGPAAEFHRLVACVQRNCTCEPQTEENPNPPLCAASRMLTDQDTLNHLAFVRLRAVKYLRAEWRHYTPDPS